MYRLSEDKQRMVLHMLVEGSSMRSTSRVVEVSINTVAKLLREAGEACREFHDETVREVPTQHVQCDELWAFIYAKDKNVPDAKTPPRGAGDVWTWTALAEEPRLMLSWVVSSERAGECALELMDDVRARVANRVQITTDGLRAYVEGVEGAFGGDVDFAQVLKSYEGGSVVWEQKRPIVGNPDLELATTAHNERMNMTTRMGVRRFTRLTNAYSKRIERHEDALALWFTHYNFIRPHASLRGTTPAVAAGLAERPYDLEWLVGLLEARRRQPGPRGPYRSRRAS